MSTSTALGELTTDAPLDTTTTDLIIGYCAMIVSCIGFGTMFIPLKGVDCRDGKTKQRRLIK